uniref:Uncharacterized protein n=1 Tax=Solanum tuberosum TaxID=4113 RepID=M1DL51_SOLTU
MASPQGLGHYSAKAPLRAFPRVVVFTTGRVVGREALALGFCNAPCPWLFPLGSALVALNSTLDSLLSYGESFYDSNPHEANLGSLEDHGTFVATKSREGSHGHGQCHGKLEAALILALFALALALYSRIVELI